MGCRIERKSFLQRLVAVAKKIAAIAGTVAEKRYVADSP
jgi:hypothetical protein